MGDKKPTLGDLKNIELAENQKVESKNSRNQINEPMSPADEPLEPNYLDNYQQLANDDMPHGNFAYPPSWVFWYRCPTAEEISVFSTTPEEDRVKILQAIIGLIRKCFLIIDTETGKEISTLELKSDYKMFYFLLLRSMYMSGEAIKINVLSPALESAIEVEFDHNTLKYKPLNPSLLAIYDGMRGFEFPNIDGDESVFIPMMTFAMETKMLAYMVSNYKKLQNDETKKSDFSNFDKKFLAFVPFLFETGKESVESLKFKYRKIAENEKLMRFYLDMLNNFKLSNNENIEYTVTDADGEEVVEETPIKFPGGYRTMFTSKEITGTYFD